MAWIDPKTGEVRDDGLQMNSELKQTARNPKQDGSGMWSCRPQAGKCPNGCNQCFYNRDNAYYCEINQPNIPTPEEVGDDIVRMNSGHDSNVQKDLVLKTAAQYKYVFFNTSVPDFDFPGPVVFTANAKEEEPAHCPIVNHRTMTRQLPPKLERQFDRLMFVRLRVSPTNLEFIRQAVACWAAVHVPVVLTFMAYYDQDPPGLEKIGDDFYWESGERNGYRAYTWRKRTLNSYYCPTCEWNRQVTLDMKKYAGSGGRNVTLCGTYDGAKCADCHNCETYYWQTRKHLIETGVMLGEER